MTNTIDWGVQTTETYFFTALEAGQSKVKAQCGQVLVRALFLASNQPGLITRREMDGDKKNH